VTNSGAAALPLAARVQQSEKSLISWCRLKLLLIIGCTVA
jgi:hypothetical protein